ncbi:MAG: hypothetical protein ABI564_16270, partial [Ideonella sp.]
MTVSHGAWFRTSHGRVIDIGVVLVGTLFIGVMWSAVFVLLRVDRENAIAAAVERNDTLAIALEVYATRIIDDADHVVQSL